MIDRELASSRASWEAEYELALSSRGVECVFLSCFDHDARFFAWVLGLEGIRLHGACTVETADLLLLATRGAVLVTDTTFLDGTWEDALAMVREAHPLVNALICADAVDREFVAKARERGAFDVLWRPVELETLRRSIRVAYEAAGERRIWLIEREIERASRRHSLPGSCLETAK